MNKSFKGIVFVAVSVGLIIFGTYLVRTDYVGYSLLCFALAVVLLLVGVNSIVNNSSPRRKYDSTVRDILNTYDSILVKSNNVPKLENRNIILVESMDDLVDAQLEIRKPICYLKQSDSCSFVLLDDKEAYVYIEKFEEKVVSPVEIEINEVKIRNKSAEEMDSEMLRDIEKTTIVKLSNKKSYKVSPVRKGKDAKKEEKVEQLEELQEDKNVPKQIVESLEEEDILDDKSSKVEFLDDGAEIL